VTASLAFPARGSVNDGSVTACTRHTPAALSAKVWNQCSEYQTRLVPSATWVTPAAVIAATLE